MLNKSYDNVLLGMNYVSVIYGILSLQKNMSCLIIDNDDVSQTSNWLVNVGELEKKILMNIGYKFQVDVLVNISEYLTPTNNLIYFNNVCVEFSHSPYLNIKEMMRKFPQNFLNCFLSFFEICDENQFNNEFFLFLDELCINHKSRLNGKDLNLEKFPLVYEVLKRYNEFTNKEKEFSKQINHILQVMYQVSFSAKISEVESHYLFISLLSPRYIIDDDKIKSELLFSFKKLGGDLRSTKINDWGIVNQRLQYIMLDCIDGVIEVDKTFLFAPPFERFPFHSKMNGNTYHSIDFKCSIENEFIDFYKNKRIIFSKNDRMGSDFPYWEIHIYDGHFVEGTYAYMDGQGVKPNFYFHQAVEDIYQSLTEILPGLLKVDWVTRVSLRLGEDIWQELSYRSDRNYDGEKSGQYLYTKSGGKRVGDIFQLGPNSSSTMGLFGHLLEILAN